MTMEAYTSALDGEPRFVVTPMSLSDVPAVLAIERVSFSSPWPARAYRFEIERNDRSRYLVVRSRGGQPAQDASGRGPKGKRLRQLFSCLHKVTHKQALEGIAGYGGLWVSGYRAHISTLAVAPQWRHQGLGLFLMLHMLDCAADLGMRAVTLEVRVSNQAARSLYEKCGFEVSGLQREYYRDNNEDALLMKIRPLTNAAHQARLASLWEELRERLGHRIVRKRRSQNGDVRTQNARRL